MSGAEAIAAIQLIDACIGIVKMIVDSGKYAHSGRGNIIANEGGTPTNYVQVEPARNLLPQHLIGRHDS
jgi:hypothetical protein